MSAAGYCSEPCCPRRATQTVTVLINPEHDDDGIWVGGTLESSTYCTEHAATLTEEIAHGEPPNIALVSVIAMPPLTPANRTQPADIPPGLTQADVFDLERDEYAREMGTPPPATGPLAFSQFPGEWTR